MQNKQRAGVEPCCSYLDGTKTTHAVQCMKGKHYGQENSSCKEVSHGRTPGTLHLRNLYKGVLRQLTKGAPPCPRPTGILYQYLSQQRCSLRIYDTAED